MKNTIDKKTCGLNGFGRFGLHLLSYYLKRKEECNFEIKYINDEILDINKALDIIVHDKYVKIYEDFSVRIKNNDTLIFGEIHEIIFTNKNAEELDWLGEPDIFLECTGKYADAEKAKSFNIDRTKKVIISATSLNADSTLVYGFNHSSFKDEDKVISYGSCTVNAYVVLANYLNKKYEVLSSDVNVIHNVPEYQISVEGKIRTPGQPEVSLLRKSCTLSTVAPILLNFLSDNNFNVNYTLIPYTGVSVIDFRFLLEGNLDKFWGDFQDACLRGDLKNLYQVSEKDLGPEVYQNTNFSSVIIKENSYIKDNNLYLSAYFDNENSVNRYFDLVNFISNQAS